TEKHFPIFKVGNVLPIFTEGPSFARPGRQRICCCLTTDAPSRLGLRVNDAAERFIEKKLDARSLGQVPIIRGTRFTRGPRSWPVAREILSAAIPARWPLRRMWMRLATVNCSTAL